jgi:predicted dehydrogenase
MWLNGPITRVTAKTETFVKERMHSQTGKMEPVGIDDACIFIAEFANGSLGVFESTRYARGHKALKTFELNGEHGSLAFNLEEMEYLDFFEYKGAEADTRGWRRIHVTNGEHPYMSHYWVPGLVIGYEHTFLNALADFVAGIESGVPAEPTFRTGLQTQKVCEAALKSGKTGAWEATGVEL